MIVLEYSNSFKVLSTYFTLYFITTNTSNTIVYHISAVVTILIHLVWISSTREKFLLNITLHMKRYLLFHICLEFHCYFFGWFMVLHLHLMSCYFSLQSLQLIYRYNATDKKICDLPVFLVYSCKIGKILIHKVLKLGQKYNIILDLCTINSNKK